MTDRAGNEDRTIFRLKVAPINPLVEIYPYGANGSSGSEQATDAKLASGELRVLRREFPIQYWQERRDLAAYDQIMRAALANRNDVTVLPILIDKFEPWARSDGTACRRPLPEDQPESGCVGPTDAQIKIVPPRDDFARAAFREFSAALAARYGPNGSFWGTADANGNPLIYRPIRAWEIWNEPNFYKFWPDPANPNNKGSVDPEQYGKLLREAQLGIRGVDSQARIVLGGLAIDYTANGLGDRLDPYEFIGEMLDWRTVFNGVSPKRCWFDAVSVHPYYANPVGTRSGDPADRGVYSELKWLRDNLNLFGANQQQLWPTEFGWGSDDAPQERGLNVVTPTEQANRLENAFTKLRDERANLELGPSLWWLLRDKGPDGHADEEWWWDAGLLAEDGSAKAAWTRMLTKVTQPNGQPADPIALPAVQPLTC